ncbi:hypothetical protein BD770DRAFT_313535 [Pilaira anomala]|nr:hypothetical protein BD770DRAFT_313535 [Pilaira anomala]
MVSNKRVLFTKAPSGFPIVGEHMKIDETAIDLKAELPEGEFILKTLEISVDPYMRGLMRDATTSSFIPAFTLNKPMSGDTMSVVINSNNMHYKVNDLVYGRTNRGLFEEYVHVSAEYAKSSYVVRNDAKENGLPLSHYVGVLAMPGLTAYYGFKEIGRPKKGETLYVSAASGAVGQLVGQFGKAMGLFVVGSAGSDDKVEYLKTIGFNEAFNYKRGDIEENLRKYCPNGIDIYFENVGGKTLDAVLAVANNFARIIGCGMISQYNLSTHEPIYNIANIVSKRIKFDGFIILDHMEYEEDFLKEVTSLLVSGAVNYKTDVIEGIDKTPEALIRVLRGENFGKQVVHVADL